MISDGEEIKVNEPISSEMVKKTIGFFN